MRCEASQLTFTKTQPWSEIYKRDDHGRDIVYLDIDGIEELESLIPLLPPPCNNSELVKLEVDYLLDLQKMRTDIDVQRILNEISFGGFNFAHIQGNMLNPYSGENELSDFITNILNDVGSIAFYFKQKFNRVRPIYLNSNIAPAIVVPRHPAYPSAHATQAHTLAMILAMFSPNSYEEFKKSAHMISTDRELAGVHYPTDTEAGFFIAKLYFENARKNARFLKDFELAKKAYNEIIYFKKQN